ncbi:hypothetical protein DXK91_08965 [Parageobacillus toebii]|nr:hypothetical protein DXK91_08965 [Parageobacillus toebii]
MLIYQGFSAPQGCPKNIFRQNLLHPPFFTKKDLYPIGKGLHKNRPLPISAKVSLTTSPLPTKPRG